MTIKSPQKIKSLTLKRIYFDYWKTQNNPDYIKFWKEVKSSGEKAYMESWFVKECKKFGVWEPLPDPFKKIDWTNFEKKPDPDIIESMNNAYGYAYPREKFPIKVDPFLPIEEILYQVRNWVYFLRTFISTSENFKNQNPFLKRNHLEKISLYARIWDLRRWERKTFQEIAKMMKKNISTISSRFYKAYELIYDEPYNVEVFEEAWRNIPKERLDKYCGTCPKRPNCKVLCPDMIFYLKSFEKKKSWREIQPKSRKTKELLGLYDHFDSLSP